MKGKNLLGVLLIGGVGLFALYKMVFGKTTTEEILETPAPPGKNPLTGDIGTAVSSLAKGGKALAVFWAAAAGGLILNAVSELFFPSWKNDPLMMKIEADLAKAKAEGKLILDTVTKGSLKAS